MLSSFKSGQVGSPCSDGLLVSFDFAAPNPDNIPEAGTFSGVDSLEGKSREVQKVLGPSAGTKSFVTGYYLYLAAKMSDTSGY